MHIRPARVPERVVRFRHTFCLGGTAALLFGVLATTGILLMVYYVPEPSAAYGSVQDILYVASFGRLIRSIHHLAADLIVFVVMLHMLRVFVQGAYRPPREFNWVVGVGLLALTLSASYTGRLLPWDQGAYWAITVSTNLLDPVSRSILLGGEHIGAATLTRFFTWHVAGIPLLIIILMSVHFWRIRHDGLSQPL